MANVFALVEELESELASSVGAVELDRIRIGLAKIANDIDPGGAFGSVDENAEPAAKAKAKRARKPR